MDNIYCAVLCCSAPPTTSLTIGEPKCIVDAYIYVNSVIPFTLNATDNTGSGIALTVYKIYNSAYDSGWITKSLTLQKTTYSLTMQLSFTTSLLTI